ncbi:hypothetical protein, partial [Yoonia sp. 76]|uniref:DUF7507 domain-containing protein n=1 Tax=Yoonia sp. 76 TaxID=3081451 RepID=UPI002AFF2CD6
WVYTATYVVTQADLDAGSFTNTATGTGAADRTGDGLGDTPLSETDTATATAAQDPSIAVVKTITAGASYAAVGDVISYEITLANDGNVTVYTPVLGDPQATSLTFVGGDAGTIGVLDVGETWVYTATYVVTQADLDAGSFTNTATGMGDADTTGDGVGNEPQMASDMATATAAQDPSIAVVKSAALGGAGAVGDVITYTFDVTNTGNVTLADVAVSDPLPGLSAIAPAGVASLAPGASAAFSASYVVTQADVDAGGVTNLATATGDDPAGVPVSAQSAAGTDAAGAPVPPGAQTPGTPTVVTLAQDPSIAVVKTITAGASYAAVGDVISYEITLANDGNVTVYTPVLGDPQATSLTFVGGDAGTIGVLD